MKYFRGKEALEILEELAENERTEESIKVWKNQIICVNPSIECEECPIGEFDKDREEKKWGCWKWIEES